MGSEASPKLPVLDFTKEDLKPGTSAWFKTSSDVRQVLANVIILLGYASESIHGYAKLAAELDATVTRMIFDSYGVEKHFVSCIKSTTYLLRLLKNRAPVGDEPNIGLISHTDKSFSAILHQDQVNGLEVDTKYGHKINVEFSPSSFVFIAGDALMAWSNDRIWSPTHRVIMNGKVNRYSMGLFTFNSGTIEVPEELVDEQHPLMYKSFSHMGFLHFFRTDEGKASKCPIKAYCGISA